MGTITRTFANNITTSGVFKPTAFNNASFDNVSSLSSATIEGGSVVLLSTQTASASASISFTTGIDSTYKEYWFRFNNIHPQTDGALLTFNLSTDGGSSYNVTKTTSAFRTYQYENIPSNYELAYQTGSDLAQSSSYQSLGTSNLGADNDQSFAGVFYLFNPSSTTYVKHFLSDVNLSTDDDRTVRAFVAGYGNTTSAINAIDFKCNSGNIDSGTIQMYGIL